MSGPFRYICMALAGTAQTKWVDTPRAGGNHCRDLGGSGIQLGLAGRAGSKGSKADLIADSLNSNQSHISACHSHTYTSTQLGKCRGILI